jgi:transcriptional regulator with XRE-family HTH domain
MTTPPRAKGATGRRSVVPAHGPDSIGHKLRALRKERGIGLRELSRLANVTPSLISEIENGQANPSVGTLFALAVKLDVATDAFFGGESDEAAPASGKVGLRRPGRIRLSGDVVWERLTPSDEHDFEFMEVCYPPGATSSDGDMHQHPGRDYLYILEGALEAAVSGKVFRLRPGESLAFDATVPHRFYNRGNASARFICIVLDRGRGARSAGRLAHR